MGRGAAVYDVRPLVQLPKQQHSTQARRLIEAREERIRQRDIFLGRFRGIVRAVDRVGRGDDRAASIEGGVDACLRNGHRLLFHHFVDCYPVNVAHLIELVNADYPTVR